MNWIEKLPYNGLRHFEGRVSDGALRVLVGQEPFLPGNRMGWHLSISHSGRIPTWDEIHAARYQLVPDLARMAMILPPKAEYVNVHPNTMHLFEVEK